MFLHWKRNIYIYFRFVDISWVSLAFVNYNRKNIFNIFDSFFLLKIFLNHVAFCYIMGNEILRIQGLRDLDRQILKNLIEDSHQPLSKIAEKVGTTRQNVSQRIKKLQEKNIIKSYTIDFNNQLIEELKVKAYILFREDPNVVVRKKNENMISKIPQITDFARLFGKYDGIIEVLVKDNNEVTEIINMLHKMKGIKETETFIVHNVVKEDKKAPILDLLS